MDSQNTDWAWNERNINGLAIRNDVDLMSAIVIAYLFGHITGVYSNLHSRILPIFESYIDQICNRKYYIL